MKKNGEMKLRTVFALMILIAMLVCGIGCRIIDAVSPKPVSEYTTLIPNVDWGPYNASRNLWKEGDKR